MGSGKPLLDEISVLASMDLLYTCTLYPPAIGGAQIHLHSLTRQLRVLGNQVQVITSCTWNRTDWLRLSTVAPEERRDTEHEGILVRQVGYSWGYRARMFPWALAYYALMSRSVRNISRLIREVAPWPEKTPSLVHASRVGREFLTRASLDYARHRGIPFVLTPNHHPRWHGYLYREYDKIYREADAVIALTEAERDQLIAQKRVRPERVHVTGIGPVLSEDFSAEKFRSDFGVPGRFVLYLGQQFKYKGIGQLVEAAPEVWRRHPDVCFVFVGPRSSYSEKLFSRVRDPRLINLGSVDLPTKTSAIAASAFLCLPSSQESFGGVFVEAWSHRKAVIGGRIPPIASVIDDGRDGLLVDQSPVELAQAIDRLLSDGDESSAMGQAGWEKVQSRYTWEMLARRTLSIYEACGTGHAFPGEASRSCGGGGGRPRSGGGGANMKILLCHNYYQHRGGEDESFDDEVTLLRAYGHEVLLYTLHNDNIPDMSRFEVMRRTLWNKQVYAEVRDLIRRERPAVMHCTNTFPLLSASILHAAHDEKTPVVQALRNYRTSCLNSFFLRDGAVCEKCLGKQVAWPGVWHGCYRDSRVASAVVAAMFLVRNSMHTWTRSVDLFFTLTEFARQKFIEGGIDPHRIVVKPNFVFPDPVPGEGADESVVFVGRLSTEKGIDSLLGAWSRLDAPLTLKIVGDGPLASQVAQAAQDDPRIQWLGRRSRDEVLGILGGAMCMVMPSIWYETFGRTVMEALAMGTPVIASRLGAMSELVADQRTGLHFTPGDPVDLAEKVRQLAGDPSKREAMRRAARVEYESKYTAHRNYEMLISIYERAMGRHVPLEREVEAKHAPVGPP